MVYYNILSYTILDYNINHVLRAVVVVDPEVAGAARLQAHAALRLQLLGVMIIVIVMIIIVMICNSNDSNNNSRLILGCGQMGSTPAGSLRRTSILTDGEERYTLALLGRYK